MRHVGCTEIVHGARTGQGGERRQRTLAGSAVTADTRALENLLAENIRRTTAILCATEDPAVSFAAKSADTNAGTDCIYWSRLAIDVALLLPFLGAKRRPARLR